MNRRDLLKTFALGLCMSALFIGSMNVDTAFAQSTEGVSPAFRGAVSKEDSILYELQADIDQYIFVDHAEEIEAMGIKVIYTGVADTYVEVGITPYKEKFAAFMYDIFGNKQVKVVDSEAAVIYTVPEENPDVKRVDKDKKEMPVMDMGDTAISDGAGDDEALIRERDQSMADEEEKISIQITSLDLVEPSEEMAPELIWQTNLVSEVPVEDSAEETVDAADIRLVSAQDAMAATSSAGDVENANKGLPTASVLVVIAGGLLIIGGTAYTSIKRRAVKK